VDKLFNVISAFVPFVGTIIQFFSSLQKKWVKAKSVKIEEGNLFKKIIIFPFVLSFILLALIWIHAILALIGAIIYYTGCLSENSEIYKKLLIILDYSPFSMIIYIVLGSILIPNLPFKLMLKIYSGEKSKWKHDPGWINADWLVKNNFNFNPISFNLSACERLANNLYKEIINGTIDYSRDRADYPRSPYFSEVELVNYWLLGNAIEEQIHKLGIGREFHFRDIWKALKIAAEHESHPFKPKNLIAKRKEGGEEFYNYIRKLAGEKEKYLPEEPSISIKVKEVLDLLVDKYHGNAIKLATPRLFKSHQSIRVLWKRLVNEFKFSKGISAQIIKLAKWSKLWPKMKLAPLIYPYSQNIALLFLNYGCIYTEPAVNSIDVDDNFMRLVAWVEDKIIDNVLKYFKTLKEEKAKIYCKNILGVRLEELKKEDLVRELDYLIWFLARNPNHSIYIYKEQEKQKGHGQNWKKEGHYRIIRETKQ